MHVHVCVCAHMIYMPSVMLAQNLSFFEFTPVFNRSSIHTETCTVCIEERLKNIHTKFEACSYHSFNDVLDQSHHYNIIIIIIIAQSGPIT